jgi:hypothetical protein
MVVDQPKAGGWPFDIVLQLSQELICPHCWLPARMEHSAFYRLSLRLCR